MQSSLRDCIGHYQSNYRAKLRYPAALLREQGERVENLPEDARVHPHLQVLFDDECYLAGAAGAAGAAAAAAGGASTRMHSCGGVRVGGLSIPRVAAPSSVEVLDRLNFRAVGRLLCA